MEAMVAANVGIAVAILASTNQNIIIFFLKRTILIPPPEPEGL